MYLVFRVEWGIKNTVWLKYFYMIIMWEGAGWWGPGSGQKAGTLPSKDLLDNRQTDQLRVCLYVILCPPDIIGFQTHFVRTLNSLFLPQNMGNIIYVNRKSLKVLNLYSLVLPSYFSNLTYFKKIIKKT